jgi:hypothetical protein
MLCTGPGLLEGTRALAIAVQNSTYNARVDHCVVELGLPVHAEVDLGQGAKVGIKQRQRIDVVQLRRQLRWGCQQANVSDHQHTDQNQRIIGALQDVRP